MFVQPYLDRREVLYNELGDKSLKIFCEETQVKVLNIIDRAIVLYTEMFEDKEFDQDELFPQLEQHLIGLHLARERVSNFKKGDDLQVVL